ncbi:MAG: DUF2723 domain-containing protein [Candidatus Neomarinimicrobiota bacterium]|nr:DUF2723 domain-containing protein [Candidatus Neomarinimicrobiota bacterium]
MIDIKYIRLNRLIAAIIFLITFVIYFDTMSPTVSYWDCGEFIAVSHTLGVPHPPGSPFFLLLGRIFSMIPFNEDIAFRVNIISPIVSALAVMLLYLTIVKIVTHWRGKVENLNEVLIVFGGASVGALTFAFTDSHWFNAVEAEVYAFSTFFTAIVVWLILLWNEKANQSGHERYILIIAYMIGLATGLHLLNLLTIPFVTLIIYFRKYKLEWQSFSITVIITAIIFFVIHNGIIKGLPKMAAGFLGVSGTALVILSVFGLMVWAIMNKQNLLSIAATSVVLILIGYSTYTLIFIRSNQDPTIDENDPETVRAMISYLEREQYGSVGQFPRRFNGLRQMYEVAGPPRGENRTYTARQKAQYRKTDLDKQWAFFWDYQIKKMYNRYFLWQFAGRGPSTEQGVTPMGANSREDGVDWTQFVLPLALILGLLGMVYHGSKDQRMSFSIMSLFLLTGYAVILYLNQDDPQPRERDYSYVGSFFAFSIWIGAGVAAVGEFIQSKISNKEISTRVISITLVLSILFVPGVMLSVNYHSHDRSGNYVAWDYSYNILQSVGPNGILFTNGDNDTFPLWYLQEVENVRKDVAVVNLSLLNTPWYIKQWKEARPDETKFINLTDKKVDEITSRLTRWEERKVQVPVKNDPENNEGYIEWTLKPTFAGQALRVQDVMILKIIKDAGWEVPIYFAVTVSQSNRIGLDPYLDMQGLTFQLKSHKTSPVDQDMMYKNLMTQIGPDDWLSGFTMAGFNSQNDNGYTNWSREYQPGYMFRNLGNKETYYNDQVIRLLQNYRSAYMQLAVTYYMDYQQEKRKKNPDEYVLTDLSEKAITVLDQMRFNIPESTIPITSEDLHYQVARLYGDLDRKESMKNILDELISMKGLSPSNKVEYANVYFRELDDIETAINILSGLQNEFIQMENMVKINGFSKGSVSSNRWKRWQKAFPDIVSSLVYIYKSTDQKLEAEDVLVDWISRFPNDNNAKKLLEEVRIRD